MSLVETVRVQCPNCWESIDVVVDCSIASQEYTEDCFVCCRPIILAVLVDEQGIATVEARREDD